MPSAFEKRWKFFQESSRKSSRKVKARQRFKKKFGGNKKVHIFALPIQKRVPTSARYTVQQFFKSREIKKKNTRKNESLFGRIKKVLIFALPNEKRVKK